MTALRLPACPPGFGGDRRISLGQEGHAPGRRSLCGARPGKEFVRLRDAGVLSLQKLGFVAVVASLLGLAGAAQAKIWQIKIVDYAYSLIPWPSQPAIPLIG